MTNKIGLNTGNNNYDEGADEYPELLATVRKRFNSIVQEGQLLFTTNAEGLYEAYLNGIPAVDRKHYTCHACEDFINKFGGLATTNKKGTMKSVMWDKLEVPEYFLESVEAMEAIVFKSRVTGVFLSESKNLGLPKTGEWNHLAVQQPKEMIFKSKLQTAEQAMAEKKEEFKMLVNALIEYTDNTVDTALTLLQSESLYRSEKVLGVAEWFKNVIEQRNGVKNARQKENIIWSAVATAPEGFCHVRSSMIGTLLDDIAEGLSFQEVSRRFKKKMDPTKYQRPQTAPSAGNTRRAEEIVKKLEIEPALHRRFARLEELNLLWKPKMKERYGRIGEGKSVFGHLETKEEKRQTSKPQMDIPAKTMTWKKFLETVLPTAEEMEFYTPQFTSQFSAIVTATNEDAPPILQWDSEEKRNPFSWYLYHGACSAEDWNLFSGYTKVTGVTLQPSMWYAENAYQGKSVFFILEGAKDIRYRGTGNALFPEILKSELHEIRSTIESYSRGERLGGYNEASACGIRLQSGSTWDKAKVRVTTKTGTAVYKLDRWD